MAKINVNIYDIKSKEYPEKLRHIKRPPEKLHVIGTLPDENKKTVAIVGARAASDYGLTLAKTIAKTLSKNNVQVVSGMALGVDTSSHVGALEADEKTYAVLGCGVDICYPAYNQVVYDKIIESGGGIISEYEEGTTPLPGLFPARNRIISGLSDVVIVVDGKKNSGSLITADFALEQGRTVFACPGRVGDALSIGPNNLIKQGAYILTSVDDVLSHLGLICDGILPKETIDITKLDYNEKLVYDVLESSAIHLDEIVDKTKLPVVKVMNVLMSLELMRVVEMTMPNYYRKV
ncbi:MAG: DNA-processing protein DprA [Lachnospiraceae bacterium]|nr:DNA-processing protein DprA [Lachnospiraceae bacterium]